MVDEVDSLTLRTITRAAILLTDAHEINLVFCSMVDPRCLNTTGLADLSRASILLRASKYGDFTFDVLDAGPLPSRAVEIRSMASAAVDLVAHNYEAALVACASVPDSSDQVAEALRLTALAAVNLGVLDTAESHLRRAVQSTHDAGVRAHLFCLLALVTTKRKNDLGASEAFIASGLRELDLRNGETTDDAVERAWLLNARALNCALEYRRTGDLAFFRAAHDLETTASRLVRVGNSQERIYLRMNLLANIAFLWESARQPHNAIRVFEQVFEGRVSSDQMARATLAYRLAVLHIKAGNNERADRVLDDLDHDLPPEEWPVVDHLLRARIHVASNINRIEEAEALARRGCALAIETRSFSTLVAHSKALLHVLGVAGRTSEARDLLDQVRGLGATQEALDAPLVLRPKLPAYIPEIDLEDVPAHDTNTRLSAG